VDESSLLIMTRRRQLFLGWILTILGTVMVASAITGIIVANL
jgi:hypothetical protein